MAKNSSSKPEFAKLFVLSADRQGGAGEGETPPSPWLGHEREGGQAEGGGSA